MAIPVDYRDLVITLTTRTRLGSVDWRAAKEGETYFAAFQSSSVSIKKAKDVFTGIFTQLRGDPIVFSLHDEHGAGIDTFTVRADEPDYAKMSELWEAIRRRVLKLDEKIRALQQELEAGPALHEEKP